MNQQFSVEYLGIKPNRYSRIPTTTGNHFFNLSQELQSSGVRKNVIKPKLQALSHKKEDSKNFYHHTTIYNVRVFKELGKSPTQQTTGQEQSFSRYTEMQTKLMVADFKKKVDAILSNQLRYRPALGNQKITSSLKELESFQSCSNEEQLNRSLCSNKYTIRTECKNIVILDKSMKAMEVLVIGNNKLLSKQIISSERIQQRLLKQMEQFLQDDRYNYDMKMQTMIDQYAEIVSRIRDQAFTIKIPENYVIQMSDYNEYYQMKQDPQVEYIQNNLDILTDQIIQEIQQSKKTTPRIQSHHTSGDIIIETNLPQTQDIIRTEPTYTKEEEIQDRFVDDTVQERKISNRKDRQRKKGNPNQNQQQQENPQLEPIQSGQSSQSELMDTSFKETRGQTRSKKQKSQKQLEQTKIDEEELLDQFTANVEEDQKIQQLNQKITDFNHKFKPKTHSRRVTEDVVLERQDPIQTAIPIDQLMETMSERPIDDCEQVEQLIKEKKEELFQFQYEMEQQIKEQQKREEDKNELSLIQKPQIKVTPFVQHEKEQREAANLWDDKNKSPATRQRKVETAKMLPDLKLEEQNTLKINEQDQPGQGVIEQQTVTEQVPQTTLETQATMDNPPQEPTIDYEKLINEKMKRIEEKLEKQSQDIFDILLASEIVYDVNIEKHKIGHALDKDVTHPNFIFQDQNDAKVFINQKLWRREVQQVIPRLDKVDKQMIVILIENEEYIDPKAIVTEKFIESKNQTDDENY